MSQHVVIANPATVELSPSPFPESWVLDGRPQAKATAVAKSQDGGMTVIAWSCTRGRFRWHYQVDEMAHILAGEVFITDESDCTRRLGPGDTVFFPAGSTSVWQVTADIRKIAVCRVAVPKLVGSGLRAWNKLRRTAAQLLALGAAPVACDGGLMDPRAAQIQSLSVSPPG
jgi:uncharacterized cupin superfamily protein